MAQEIIDLVGVVGVGSIDGGQGIQFHAVFQQQFQSVHGLCEDSLPVRVLSIYIMQMLGAVDADTDAEMVVAEEAAPVVGEQRAIGLQGVENAATSTILLLQLHSLLEEGNACEGGLATVPGELYLGPSTMDGDDLLDVAFQDVISHQGGGSGLPAPRPQIVAVLAPQVAGGTYGLNLDGVMPIVVDMWH